MKHIRLNNNNEFYKNNLKGRFLGNIADINIIVGANNTRKSRFLREIINQEHHVLVESSDKLNDTYFSLNSIFEEITLKGKDVLNETLIQVQFHEDESPGTVYTNIKEFFNTKSQIDTIDLKSAFTNIGETLAAFAIEKEFEAWQTMVKRVSDVTNLLIWVYDKLEQNNVSVENINKFMPTNVQNVRYLVELGAAGIPNFHLRLLTFKKAFAFLNVMLQTTATVFSGKMIYVPVLRSSRSIGSFTDDVYADTILKQHFSNPNGKLSIETGLMLYKKIGFARNSSRKQARDFTLFEKFIGETFYRSDDLHIVAEQSEKADQRNIRVTLPGELEDIAIQDLGDGVQAIINLLFPIFTAEEGSWIFIDEPENHLHPGYQNILMQALANNQDIKDKHLRFFINTHSNHILSGALMSAPDAEILVFNRRNSDSSAIQSFNGNEYHTLELLGIFNTSVLTSNCTVWIEGVTDRFYLQAFLYAYSQTLESEKLKPIEGMHYSFVEYGGKNLIHYEFDHELYPEDKIETKKKIDAYFINANVFLLADTDFNKEKHLPFEKISRTNFIYCQTDVPEIENLLPEEILRSYLTDELKCNKNEVNSCFKDDYNVKLGTRFKDKLTYGKNFRKTEGDGGTLNPKYKKALADYVHQKILDGTFTWNHLKKSTTLKKTVETLYTFLNSKNELHL